MEKIVTLSLAEHLELKEFRERIEGGEYFIVTTDAWGSDRRTTFYTKEKIADEFTAENASLLNEISNLYKRLGKEEAKIAELKRMSFWQMCKWWKENKYIKYY